MIVNAGDGKSKRNAGAARVCANVGERRRTLADLGYMPFHGENTGSNPVGDANEINALGFDGQENSPKSPMRSRVGTHCALIPHGEKRKQKQRAH